MLFKYICLFVSYVFYKCLNHPKYILLQKYIKYLFCNKKKRIIYSRCLRTTILKNLISLQKNKMKKNKKGFKNTLKQSIVTANNMDKSLTITEIKNFKMPTNQPEWESINNNCIPNDAIDVTPKLKPIDDEQKFVEMPDISSDSDNVDELNSINLSSPIRCLKNNMCKCNTCEKINDISYLLPVSVAESVTAGALSNTLCSEPGSSKFFLGGIIAYNMETQKTLLDVDEKYAELNNFANPFTTYTMAKNVTNIFQSRIGISTTGFSLPLYRKEDLDNGKCEINVKTPYAYICLYDALLGMHKIFQVSNDDYSETGNQRVQRAQMQAKIALKSKKIFEDYCRKYQAK